MYKLIQKQTPFDYDYDKDAEIQYLFLVNGEELLKTLSLCVQKDNGALISFILFKLCNVSFYKHVIRYT